ncbi:MAG: hypothetical protein [Microvirus sp.]|nr:MAG: hypothetical protein [Microvirus sp.]
MKRYSVNKRRSARNFRRSTSRTKMPNISPAPQRGGWRL